MARSKTFFDLWPQERASDSDVELYAGEEEEEDSEEISSLFQALCKLESSEKRGEREINEGGLRQVALVLPCFLFACPQLPREPGTG